MLKLRERALDWVLLHLEAFGDTDTFPVPFEFQAIRYDWDNIKDFLLTSDITKWQIGAHRQCLAPKHKYAFRISTQPDPLDSIIFCCLACEIGKDLELARIPKQDNIAFSFRFKPDKKGRLYDFQYTWDTFQNTACSSLSQASLTTQ